MLPLSPLRFSTIGKPILRTFEILKIFRFFDNSSRTRAKARAKATARAMARARATARARRTRARAKDRARARDGRTDGRTAGRSYLFSEMRNPVSDEDAVLIMVFPLVGNRPTPCGSIFTCLEVHSSSLRRTT